MNIEHLMVFGVKAGLDDDDILETLAIMGLADAARDDFGQPYGFDTEMYELVEKVRVEHERHI